MTKFYHKQIAKYFPYLFADETKKENDPWWQVSKGINQFNLNCQKMLKTGKIMVLDEAMSPWCPRTTATGE